MSEPLTADTLRRDIAEMLYQEPEEVGRQDDLLAAGLDSVRLLSLVERWRDNGFTVSFVELATNPTLEAWAKLLRARLGGDAGA